MMAAANIHLPDMMRRITLTFTITGKRRTAARVWLAVRITHLAGIVAGTNIALAFEDDDVTA